MTVQASLFDSEVSSDITSYEGSLPTGLIVIPNFLSKAQESDLLAIIDGPGSAPWMNDLSRRVKHFGFRYNYKARGLSSKDKIDAVPIWARELGERLVDNGYFESSPQQVIINEYLPGQGIASHVDRHTCFGATVASVSLGSDIVMDFSSVETNASGRVLLRARSAVVLSGDARYRWKHGIAARKRDSIDRVIFDRQRRLSLTFRTVVLDES
jgi:alkylated DNA repair dioxygenase AlkB